MPEGNEAFIGDFLLQPFPNKEDPPPMSKLEEWRDKVFDDLSSRGLVADNPEEVTDSLDDIYEHLAQGYLAELKVFSSGLASATLELSYSCDPDLLEAVRVASSDKASSRSMLHAIRENRFLPWPDGAFKFTCERCGHCCSNAAGVFLRPLDVLVCCEFLGVTTRELIENYADFSLEATNSHFPVLITRKDEDGYCCLYDRENKSCALPLRKRPAMCRLYPVARQLPVALSDMLEEAISHLFAAREEEGEASLALLVNTKHAECKYFLDGPCRGKEISSAEEGDAMTIQEFVEDLFSVEETLFDNLFFSAILAFDLLMHGDDAMQVAPFFAHAVYRLDEPIFGYAQGEEPELIDMRDGLQRRMVLFYFLSKTICSGLVAEEDNLEKVRATTLAVIGQMVSAWQIATLGIDMWQGGGVVSDNPVLPQITELLSEVESELGEVPLPDWGRE